MRKGTSGIRQLAAVHIPTIMSCSIDRRADENELEGLLHVLKILDILGWMVNTSIERVIEMEAP